MRPAIALVLLSTFAVPVPGHAQLATLSRDLTPEGYPGEDSRPTLAATVGGRVVFFANKRGLGRQLWASDGTSDGTGPLSHACTDCRFDRPVALGTAGGKFFWSVELDQDSITNHQLWVTDGTRAGTEPLTSAATSEAIALDGPTPAGLPLGELVLFVASSPGHALSLWASDGTTAGTRPLQEPSPRTAGSDPSGLRAVGELAFYFAYASAREQGLWVSDGTPAGTRLVTTVPSRPPTEALVTATRDRLFFLADDAAGRQLWVSDGTAAGTQKVTAFADASAWVDSRFLKAAGGRVFFLANDGRHGLELWQSDGTPAGTAPVTNFRPSRPFSNLSPDQVAVLGAQIYFVALNEANRLALWTTPGSPSSVRQLQLLGNDDCIDLAQPGRELVPSGRRLYFASCDGGSTVRLWSTDGAPRGTREIGSFYGNSRASSLGFVALPGRDGILFVDCLPGLGCEINESRGDASSRRLLTRLPAPTDPSSLALGSMQRTANGTIFFTADDRTHGLELWAVEPGLPESTRLVLDIEQYTADTNPGALQAGLGGAVFSTDNTYPTRFWLSDGTAAGTNPLAIDAAAGCEPGVEPGRFLAATESFLLASCGRPSSLLLSDGTAAGTVALTHQDGAVVAGTEVEIGGRVLGRYEEGPFELWATDGTAAGTTAFLPRNPQVGSSVGRFRPLADRAYFWRYDGTRSELWETDGTAAGTVQRTHLSDGTAVVPATDTELVRLGDWLLTTADTPSRNGTLWRLEPNGDLALVADPEAGEIGYDPHGLTELGGRVYLFSSRYTGVLEPGLWSTDGTAAGTVEVRPGLRTRRYQSEPFAVARLGGWLLMGVDDGEHGYELWRSDGTGAGTVLLADILPGPESSHPTQFLAAGGRLFFTATTRPQGTELWVTDGTPAGTRLVQDIYPGPFSSSPEQLTIGGEQLYFTADDGVHGRELWSLPLDGGPACRADELHLCLADGKYRVEMFWQDFAGQVADALAAPLTADTGTFFFRNPDNREVILKVLDGQGVNGHQWVFYGALSNTQYWLTVTDAETGVARRYFNPEGRFASRGDTEAFGPLGASLTSFREPAEAPGDGLPLLVDSSVDSFAGRGASGSCGPTATRLCLGDGRFAVEATWRDFQDRTGSGQAVPLTGDTGYFWFFGPDNVEVMLKVLDATAVNGHTWVFYGALSNVEYTLTVTDTVTGAAKTYANPRRRFGSVGDTQAF